MASRGEYVGTVRWQCGGRHGVFLLLWLFVVYPITVLAEYRHEFVTDVDPYYSSAGLYLSPEGDDIPYVDSTNETVIYRDLLLRSYRPHDVVLEASVYPMPIIGTLIRSRMPGFYDDMQLSSDFNLVKSVTLGFDEPYAVSLFLGNVVKYRAGELAKVGDNKGYMGYLFSYGSKHIKDNALVDDKWWEFEWKVKGDRDIDAVTHSWSFRVGGKWHGNEEITDIYYIGLRRSHLDFDAPILSWLPNSGFDYQVAFSQHDNSLVEQQLFFDKKLPLRAWHFAVDIELGLIWKKAAKYTGNLAGQGAGEEIYLVLRPNIEL